MTKKKGALLSLAAILFFATAALSGFIGANLTIDNGRIEFINSRNSIYIGKDAGLNAYNNGTGVQCHNLGIGEFNLQDNICKSNWPNYGTRNVCVGNHACEKNQTGDRNIAIGVAAHRLPTNSNFDVAIGYHAMAHAGDSGNDNVAIGRYAQQRIKSNTRKNVSIGANSLEYNEGQQNVAIGANSGWQAKGSSNIFIGSNSGRHQISGDNNLYIGTDANGFNNNASNQFNLNGLITSENMNIGHIKLRKNAGLELTNDFGDTYRLVIDNFGNLDIVFVN